MSVMAKRHVRKCATPRPHLLIPRGVAPLAVNAVNVNASKLAGTGYWRIGPNAGPRRELHTGSVAAKVVSFNLADIGEGIAEAEILQWHVKEGDKVEQFDKICEVQSDKATVEITSRFDGVVNKLHYDISDMAIVGQPLVDIEVDDDVEGDVAPATEDAEETSSQSAPAAPTAAAVSAGEENDGKILTTPAVRRLSREHGIALHLVRGTGKGGRVLKEDMLRHIEMLEAGQDPTAIGSAGADAGAGAGTGGAPKAPFMPATPAPAVVGEDVVEPIRGLKRTMVKTMVAANAVPHFGYCDEFEMDGLVSFREEVKEAAASQGVRLSYMPMFVKAASMALSQYPVLNSSVDADATAITYKASHNIGVAMDTPAGLLVPNVKNVQAKSVLEVAAELNRLQALGSEGKLGAEDLTGGTFTLSNIGSIGGTYAKPVLLVPEVAIGAIGKMQTLPRFRPDGSVYPARFVQVSWAADHRVIDGATMARFSNVMRDFLSNPAKMLLSLR